MRCIKIFFHTTNIYFSIVCVICYSWSMYMSCCLSFFCSRAEKGMILAWVTYRVLGLHWLYMMEKIGGYTQFSFHSIFFFFCLLVFLNRSCGIICDIGWDGSLMKDFPSPIRVFSGQLSCCSFFLLLCK